MKEGNTGGRGLAISFERYINVMKHDDNSTIVDAIPVLQLPEKTVICVCS